MTTDKEWWQTPKSTSKESDITSTSIDTARIENTFRIFNRDVSGEKQKSSDLYDIKNGEVVPNTLPTSKWVFLLRMWGEWINYTSRGRWLSSSEKNNVGFIVIIEHRLIMDISEKNIVQKIGGGMLTTIALAQVGYG